MSIATSPSATRALDVLHAGDTDLEKFLSFFSDDTVLRMANSEPVIGRSVIQAWIGGYLRGVSGVRHEPVEIWEREDTVVVRVEVTYTMQNGETFTLPAVTRMRFADERLSEYHIFMDPAPVVAAAQA